MWRLMAALETETVRLVERPPFRRIMEDAERAARGFGIEPRPFQRRGERAVVLHQPDGAFEIAVALLAGFEGAAPEFALVFVRRLERQHHRQRDLAVAEIVADRLAELRLPRRIIEHVVDQLEGDAEIAAIGF